MAVNVNGRALLMQGPEGHGWWRLDVTDAASGTDYGYIIDHDETCYPDPRSQWQPAGVHGLSRLYKQGEFGWTDDCFQPRPLGIGILDELHIGPVTPAGTMEGADEETY